MISEDEFRTFIEDYNACERGEFILHVLAFTVATRIVEEKNFQILNRLPAKLVTAVLNIARVYKRDGSVISQSNLGSVHHNELGAKLSALLEPILDSYE